MVYVKHGKPTGMFVINRFAYAGDHTSFRLVKEVLVELTNKEGEKICPLQCIPQQSLKNLGTHGDIKINPYHQNWATIQEIQWDKYKTRCKEANLLRKFEEFDFKTNYIYMYIKM